MSGIVISAGLFGWWLARRQTRRLVQLAGAAEDVARTGHLGIQVPVAGRDEVGRLGRSFDRMLVRLAQSEEDQRRLVQDAGHELRTPLTSSGRTSPCSGASTSCRPGYVRNSSTTSPRRPSN